MLYHIPRVSMRPLTLASTITRRVLKAESTSSTQWAAKRTLYVASTRSYGTTISKPRAAAKPTTTSKATQTKSVTPAKKTAAKAKKPVKKPVTKAKKKPATRKVAKKVVKKSSRPKKITKKALEDKEKEKLRALKETALLDEPKKGSQTVWINYLAEFRASPGSDVKSFEENQALVKEASKQFKVLPPAEIERLNHVTNQKNKERDVAYKKWVSSHTPAQIRQANLARSQLQRRERDKLAAKGNPVSSTRVGNKFSKIVDDRLPKNGLRPYIVFCKERWESGDMKSLKFQEAAKLLGEEWRSLSESARKTYSDRSASDLLRASQEKQTVFQ